MNRSLLIGILATIVLFSGIAVFFYLNNIKVKGREAIDAVPNDAFFIIQSRNILASWKSLKESDLWGSLSSTPPIDNLNKKVAGLRELFEENDEMQDLLSGNATVISLHNVSERLGMLVVAETGENLSASDFANAIATHIRGKAGKRAVEKIPVFDVTDASGNYLLTISFYDQLMICSGESGLVEDALRKLKYRLPNMTNGFKQVQLLADQGADLNLYINYQKMPKLFSLFTKPGNAGLFSYMKAFANWSMLDIKLAKDQFNITGVTYTDDSVFQFLDLFKNQTPKVLKLQELMPANTTFALQMGFTDYMKFNAELGEYLQVHNKAEAYGKFTDSIENRYDIDISQRILPFIDGEAALVMIQPTGSDYRSNLAAFIRFKDPASMGLALKSFVHAMSKKGEADSAIDGYEGVEIERIRLDNFLKLYYGEIMENIRSPYYSMLDDVFVFANDVNTLKHIIAQYKMGQTLANDEKYKEYASSLAQNNNVNVFISPAGNFSLPADFVTDEFFSTLNTYQLAFKKLTFLNIQFANTNNKAFYTHVQYKFNSGVSNETQQLWATRLDTVFDVPPQVVYNSKLKQPVIFVQDVKNTLYCIGNSGNVIWKSKLSARLVGDFITLDAQNNGKTCYLFSTEKQVNLVDEEGVSLPNYPIGYPGKAVFPLTLNKTEGDSAITYFVPLENNRIMAYNLSGRPLSGWNPKIIDNKPAQEISLFKQGSKQMVYVTDVKGKLWVFNDRGQRLKLAPGAFAARYTYVPSADTGIFTFHGVDTGGRVMRYVFDSLYKLTDSSEVTRLKTFDKITAQTDAVTQKTYFLAMNEAGWSVYDQDYKVVLNESTKDSALNIVYFTHDAAGRIMLAKTDRSKGEYYWYDMNGKLHADFPLKGFSAFNTGDVMLDRSDCLVGGDDRNNIFVYRFK
jgi:hypothetical protein